MSEMERRREDPPEKRKADKREDPTTAYTTTAVGVGLLVAAVLVIITAGTPAAGIGFIIGAAACLGWSIPKILQHRGAISGPDDREKQLLTAIRENGGSITPAEAAMETSLTVREADAMLTELASAGHLAVESRHGVLSYTLPSRRDRELGG